MMETLVISVLFKNRIVLYTSGLIPLTELLLKVFLVEDFVYIFASVNEEEMKKTHHDNYFSV